MFMLVRLFSPVYVEEQQRVLTVLYESVASVLCGSWCFDSVRL